MLLEDPANNGGFLWSGVYGARIPIDYATHTNEPPGFECGWIERVDLTSGEVTVLHKAGVGRPLRGPNDLVFDDAGGLWFTDHGKGRHTSVDRGGLYYVTPDLATVREVAFPLLGPNGVGLSPDGRRVYVAETFTGTPGRYVPVKETVRGFKEIIEGKHDDLPEAAFMFVGGIEEAREKAERMAQESR